MKPGHGILIILLMLHSSIVLSQNRAKEDINHYITRAEALKDRSMFAEAIALYNEALALGEDYRLFTGRGDALLSRGDVRGAIDDFVMAGMLEPGAGSLGLARAYAMSNDIEQAVSSLKEHLRSDFKLPRREILLDSSFLSLESTPEWRELWKGKWYTQLEEAVHEIEYLVETGKISEAENVLSDIEKLYSEQTEIKYLKGVLEAARNNVKLSLQYLSEAVATDKPPYNAWMTYIRQLAENDNYLGAAEACDRAFVLYPAKTGLILLKSENLRLAGDRDRALEAAEYYSELYPGDEEANRQVGKTASEKGEYNKALRYFSENIGNYPGKAQCFTDRGDIYMRMKAWDAAVYDYSMALDLWPRDGQAYYNKGLALLNSGKTEEACHDFRMALRYGYRKASGMISRYCIK
ncbi:MAG: tetratricopeptide repeat protein [Bacteroidota bacterium]